ncbi:MAG TPA: pyridoxal phosphate-dependent aminotransferase family protein [Pirellulales bacterium]|nr:pyridoxal phosphate-dependent aminotransferase family protein [Pirellulales bacterium]
MPMAKSSPLDGLVQGLQQSKLVRFFEQMDGRFGSIHLKELAVAEVGPRREMRIAERELVNFGFDSFLGLDQHPKVAEALVRGTRRWGTQFGASRAFAVCQAELDLESRIARWMGTEAALIFPSVTLANVGVLPGLVEPKDLIAIDEFAHNSIQEGAKIAQANGVRVVPFAHNDPLALERVLVQSKPYRTAVVAIDGVYSMSGAIADMAGLNAVARRHDGVLYIDDAHATAVAGDHGRGTVLEALGSYDNTIVVGCFSKACSVFGAFVACTRDLKRLLKMRSNTYIFGGPVPPPYLEAACAVIDILRSREYQALRAQLDGNIRRMASGLAHEGLVVLGGHSPITSVLVGDEEDTFRAGKFLFDRGYYVQSVTFPAVPYHAGVLRVQVNANHTPAAIDGLVAAIGELKQIVRLPTAEAASRRKSASPPLVDHGRIAA